MLDLTIAQRERARAAQTSEPDTDRAVGSAWEPVREGPVQMVRQTHLGRSYMVGIAGCFDFNQTRAVYPDYLEKDIEDIIRSERFRLYASMPHLARINSHMCRGDMPAISSASPPLNVSAIRRDGSSEDTHIEMLARAYMSWCTQTHFLQWNFRPLRDGTIAINNYDDDALEKGEYVGVKAQ